jgi:hypothetical protein
MEFSEEPENKPLSSFHSDEEPVPGDKSTRKPKVVVSSGMITQRHDETGKSSFPTDKEKIGSGPASGNGDKAASNATPNITNDSQSSSMGTESQPTRSASSSHPTSGRQPPKSNNPGRRLHAFEAAARKGRAANLPWRYRLVPTREKTRRAYWDIATTFSLLINAVLVGALIIMAGELRNLKATVNGTVNDLLGGLYGNFVKMDQASINTTILVNAQIPLDFTLPVSQNTVVVLTQDVSIPSAHVVINTGVLNINAKANVTLPAGTALPIALNLAIPVQSTIPISLQVPVNIPLDQTELHGPFTGLQTTLRPLYCLFNKDAQYPEGIYICAEHDTSATGTP